MKKNTKNTAKIILMKLGINDFIAVKANYNSCVGKNDFYSMIKRRSNYKTPIELAQFLRSELNVHYKEYAQYQ